MDNDPDELTREDIEKLADEREEANYIEKGEVAYGRPDDDEELGGA